LSNQNYGKTRELNDANKEARNAKNMAAGKDEGGEAKDAQDDKQRHLASERRMKWERGDALAAMQEQSKHNRHARPKLEVEHFVLLRMLDAASNPRNTLLPSPDPV
jgi:hypothetical protein